MMTNRENSKPNTPAVHIPPPVIVAAFLAVGLGVDTYLKGTFGAVAGWIIYLGIGLCILGFGIAIWCALLYRKARTSILPHTKDSNLIESGPFRRSRNPIYLSMLIVFMGICLLLDAPAAMLFAIPTYFALRYYVIAREETYLSRRFGDAYTSYQSRVRRWI